MTVVRVETVARGTEPVLPEGSAGMAEAIHHASEAARRSLAGTPDSDGWQISGLEVTFGLTPAPGDGVVGSGAGADASFEVRLTVERGPGRP
ncbi:hypothetical protein [Streptomyces sp. NPDC001985]|uniref:hypothetical protein n=1 Tax=Streptomyces sp. NPDC001985 TaxID=3154406 RepID=UPI003331B29B